MRLRALGLVAGGVLPLLLAGCVGGSTPSPSPSPTPTYAHPYLDPSLPIDDRVDDLLSRMTMNERFGQMIQIEEHSLASGDVAHYRLGSVLHGGGAIGYQAGVEEWASAVDAHLREAVEDTRLGIPLIYGVDATHGFGGLYGGTIFPHQIGLGAADDADLVRRIGRATAEETAAAGIRWNFGPVLAISSDIRWGRTYEAYSQDPERVSRLGAAYIEGLQGSDLTDSSSVIATPKHYLGDGSTVYGTSTQVVQVPFLLDQGNVPADPDLLATLLVPYAAAIDAGSRTVMASFSSWDGVKVHARTDLLTDVLRDDLGFTGFVVSDWAACDQINPADTADGIAQCVNAGVDMIMVPYDAQAALTALQVGVTSGNIAAERIDEAVSRILTVKFEMGLFEEPYRDANLEPLVGSATNRDLAREAVAKSLVLLENDGALPIAASASTIVVVGNAADDMGRQAGGWTQSWQGDLGPAIPGTTILEGITERAGAGATVLDALPEEGSVDVCVAAVGEEPYAEGVGDSTDLALPGLEVLESLDGRCGSIVLVVVSGRPVIITSAVYPADAVVAAWLPGTAGEGIADVLFGDVGFTGTLPMNWPRDLSQVPSEPGDPALYPIGYGLSY